MNSESKIRKGEAFIARAIRAGALPVSMLAAAQPVEPQAPSRPKAQHGPPHIPVERRAAEQLVGGLPLGRSSKDVERIARLTERLLELKTLDEQRLQQHG